MKFLYGLKPGSYLSSHHSRLRTLSFPYGLKHANELFVTLTELEDLERSACPQSGQIGWLRQRPENFVMPVWVQTMAGGKRVVWRCMNGVNLLRADEFLCSGWEFKRVDASPISLFARLQWNGQAKSKRDLYIVHKFRSHLTLGTWHEMFAL